MQNRHASNMLAALLCVASVAALSTPASAAGYRLVGWNNLGMHCMDRDFSLFSLLPPFNTIQAQLVDPSGKLVTDPGSITVRYEAVADPSGSINTSSAGKTNFWDFEDDLFGASLPVDTGLAGFAMPGAANTPQAMAFDAASSEWIATGIPIAPQNDAGLHDTYPMMRLVARDGSGNVLAKTDIVLPVSDEMSCKSCHASGSSEEAKPESGWANDADEERDVRRNVLRLHDTKEAGDPQFEAALAQLGMDPAGLEATALGGRSILCASCHLSEALPGSGIAGIQPLTQAMHTSMAGATDPTTGMKLDDVSNRSACYSCHPGSKTRCLRGAMGAAVAADGSMAMQCQSCHGHMKDVGSPLRTGWLEEPRCDSCHTGTATHNNGQIRFDSVFESDGSVRNAVDDTFATNDGAPAAGLSLYRFSKGHGGLECSSCHGSTHAEFPSSHGNDNIQNIKAQGHEGVLSECTSCHATVPSSPTGGPHGLHPIGASWVGRHGDIVETSGTSGCKSCHGSDLRGTVLSRAQADRSFSTEFGARSFWRGSTIGCYACHAGPNSESASRDHAAVAKNAEATTSSDTAVAIALVATDADGDALTLRIVSQPEHGTVGLSGKTAKYFPDGSFSGDETFTFAAWDGSLDSNLATVTVHVGTTPCPAECLLPGGACDPLCSTGASRDAMVVAPKPLRAKIPAGASSVRKSVTITVENMDAAGADPGLVHLDVLDGDCPAGTVASAPAFAGGASEVMLAPGAAASAKVAIEVSASAFTTDANAPARCRLLLRATPVGAQDPVPSNNEAPLELSVTDWNDRAPGATDAYLMSVGPVKFEIAAGASSAARGRKPKIVFTAPSGAAATQVQVTLDDGSCPPGTVDALDMNASLPGEQDSVTLSPGLPLRGRFRVNATSSAFSTPLSPTRCNAFVTLHYAGEGGEVTNDLSEFAVTVLDGNDLLP